MSPRKIIALATLALIVILAAFVVYKSLPQNASSVTQTVKYTCPMHPDYISDKPGDCPICGMKLVPMKTEPVSGTTGMPGLEKISISPEQEQLIGVKTDSVKKRKLEVTIRAAGRVAHDLELYNTLSEYKQILSTYQSQKAGKASAETLRETEVILDASRFKLAHLGISAELANSMVKENKFSGLLYVDKAGVKVWIYAQIYDYESGLIKPGQTLEATAAAIPGKKFTGIIKSLGSYLDADTRTLRVRAEVENKEGLLRPDMYVDTVIHIPLGEKLAVPFEAVLDTGTRRVVFVKTGKGLYEPREITAGAEADNYYEVLAGLKEGEEVVTSSNFLIDSESRLKALNK